jgi:hypothetical protein
MRGHSLAIANHSTSHLAWQLTGWSPRQAIAFPHPPRCVKRSYPEGNRIQQLQQQIEAWQALSREVGRE